MQNGDVCFVYIHLVATAVTQTGLTELRSGSDICTKQVLTYSCITAGRGATEVTLDNETLSDLEFPHGQYIDGSAVNQSNSPYGDVVAGNLSRSQTEECPDKLANSTSYCYRTMIQVHLNERTRCRSIGCRTRFRIGGEDKLVDFGNAILTRGE